MKKLLSVLLCYSSLHGYSLATEEFFNDLEQARTYFRAKTNPQHEVGRQIILDLCKKDNHPHRFDAIQTLFESDKEEDQTIASEILLRTLLFTDMDAHHNRWRAASILFNIWKNNPISSQYKIIGARELIKPVHINRHTDHFNAARYLYNLNTRFRNDDIPLTNDQLLGLEALRNIIRTPVNATDMPMNNVIFMAAELLDREPDEVEVWRAYRELINVAPPTPNHFKIGKKLFEKNEGNDREQAIEAFRIVVADHNWEIREAFEAAEVLEDNAQNIDQDIAGIDRNLCYRVYNRALEAHNSNIPWLTRANTADKLFASHNQVYRDTALKFYIEYAWDHEGGFSVTGYSQGGTKPRHLMFHKIFEEGPQQDIIHNREVIKEFARNTEQRTLRENARRALNAYGSEEDRNFVRNLPPIN